MNSAGVAAWASVTMTFLAVLVALFKEDLRLKWRKPKLKAVIRLTPPGCHKTEITVTNQQTGEVVDRLPCYYLRIWVENTGNQRAEQVQVFASGLWRKQLDGTFGEQKDFLRMNLLWAHIARPFLDGLSPNMGQYCDLGRVVHPSKASAAGDTLPGVPPGKTILALSTEVRPNTKTHLLAPGVYQLELKIAASNCKPVSKKVELNVTGEWFDHETPMFAHGLGIREVS
jgi:hypothetical protein